MRSDLMKDLQLKHGNGCSVLGFKKKIRFQRENFPTFEICFPMLTNPSKNSTSLLAKRKVEHSKQLSHTKIALALVRGKWYPRTLLVMLLLRNPQTKPCNTFCL